MFKSLGSTLICVLVLGCVYTVLAGESERSTNATDVLDKTWQWISTITPVEQINVTEPERYTLQLISSGKAQIQFDCNRGSGDYTISAGKLAFGPLLSTRMACPEDTQDALFMKDLQNVAAFFVQSGDLYLELPNESGTMHFQLAESVEPKVTSPFDAVYIIEDQRIRLYEGTASQPLPGSDSKIETRIFKDPAFADVNSDGVEDAILFLQHQTGGSGNFYYVAAALVDSEGWVGTNAIFLGDRITPQSIEIDNGVITIHFLGRQAEEAMSSPATVDLSRTLIVKNQRLIDYER